jgi:hypothetical protein
MGFTILGLGPVEFLIAAGMMVAFWFFVIRAYRAIMSNRGPKNCPKCEAQLHD